MAPYVVRITEKGRRVTVSGIWPNRKQAQEHAEELNRYYKGANARPAKFDSTRGGRKL